MCKQSKLTSLKNPSLIQKNIISLFMAVLLEPLWFLITIGSQALSQYPGDSKTPIIHGLKREQETTIGCLTLNPQLLAILPSRRTFKWQRQHTMCIPVRLHIFRFRKPLHFFLPNSSINSSSLPLICIIFKGLAYPNFQTQYVTWRNRASYTWLFATRPFLLRLCGSFLGHRSS